MLNWIFAFITVANLGFICYMLFVERFKPVVAMSWILLFIFIPVLGFVMYLLLGNGVRLHIGRTIRRLGERNLSTRAQVDQQLAALERGERDLLPGPMARFLPLVGMNLRQGGSALVTARDIRYFTAGDEKFESLFADIREARSHIHLNYFIINNDRTGRELTALLAEKAAQGVQVRLLYDAFGSFFTPMSMFRALKRAGGEVERFYPASAGLNFLNLRANYRNHRKIVVIDGEIGYIGGMNVGDEYRSRKPRVSPWRDTHARVCGPIVHAMQAAFLDDWLYALRDRASRFAEPEMRAFYPEMPGPTDADRPCQLLLSGPERVSEPIKDAFIRMIVSAQRIVRIQTPYFVPDESFMEALSVCKLAGVRVQVMLPDRPDKDFTFRGTLSYVPDLLDIGAEVYLYHGFLHAKSLLVDDEILSVGSSNMDIRSFALCFEANLFLYDEREARRYAAIFEHDLRHSERVDMVWYNDRPLFDRFREAICRLLSPLL